MTLIAATSGTSEKETEKIGGGESRGVERLAHGNICFSDLVSPCIGSDSVGALRGKVSSSLGLLGCIHWIMVFVGIWMSMN